MYNLEIAPGVNVSINSQEYSLVQYLKKYKTLSSESLTSEVISVINILMSKGIILRSKKGENVYYKLRSNFTVR